MIFRKADIKDAKLIADSMKEIRSNMKNPSMYVIDSEEDLRYYIDGTHGFALLAFEEETLAGFFIFRFPDLNETDHLGEYLQLSDVEKEHVVYMDSAAVFPAFRGQGLQGKLLRKGEEMLKDTDYTIALATIAPDNPASLNTLLKDGFEIITTTEKYGGLIRHILHKQLGDS